MGLRSRIKKRNFTDGRLKSLLNHIVRNKSKFWNAVGEKLTTPRNKRVALNVGQIDRHFEKGLTLVVPGKVLGSGSLSNKVEVAAYSFSRKAAESIEGAGGKIKTLEEFLEENPEGKKAKMVI